MRDTAFVYGAVAVILLAVIASPRRGRSNLLIFGAAWFFIFLLPSFIMPNPGIAADFLEHRLYLPMVGFLVILSEIFKPKKIPILGIIALAAFSAIIFIHCGAFKDRMSFWKNAAVNSPHSPLARRNLGAMYYLDGHLAEAEVEYKKALELNPNEPMAHNNLGLIYAKRGEFAEAEAEYKKELAINPLYDDALFNYGLFLDRAGRKEEAKRLWECSLEVNPDYKDLKNKRRQRI